jgi:YegS/Rv2252/BmrU family lipid kinase
MSDRPTLIVVNPKALRLRESGLSEQIHAAVRPGRVELLVTEGPDHARRFCAEHAARFAKIVVAGGDGLLNEVADGSFGQPTAIAPLPAGSGNDYVKALPGYPVPLADLLASNEVMPGDMGEVTFSDGTIRRFLSEAGAGMDAACVRLMPQWLSRISTVAGYNVGAIGAIISYKPYAATVTIDGRTSHYDRVHMLAVANTTYFGDGMRLAPDARFDDGQFHVVIVKDASKFELLRSFKMLREGTHITHPEIVYRPCKEIVIEPDRPLEMCIDGDYVSKTPAKFENLPAHVRLVKPA